jgi:FlaA1/EpsC-like NDP-sugar epimerase
MLITGGTGAFGQAFVKACLDANMSDRICVYSRDEYKQYQMAEAFNDDRLRFFIGDVRDEKRLRRAMEGVTVVVHAAALKRIETGFYNPEEMVKTNVGGTMNVIEASHNAGVEKVVYLSTDKAYQPISAYGLSKALGESLILAANNTHGAAGPEFSVTRYGNVANSTGSVIPIWRQYLREGKCLRISDPEVTRFFMTMDEAVELVMKAIVLNEELLIPELPAYRLGDLAEAAQKLWGHEDHAYLVTGLGKYEKLHEGMEDGNTSDKARRMSAEELRDCLTRIR